MMADIYITSCHASLIPRLLKESWFTYFFISHFCSWVCCIALWLKEFNSTSVRYLHIPLIWSGGYTFESLYAWVIIQNSKGVCQVDVSAMCARFPFPSPHWEPWYRVSMGERAEPRAKPCPPTPNVAQSETTIDHEIFTAIFCMLIVCRVYLHCWQNRSNYTIWERNF